eukprot:1156443-Pelagomonas_calceolata.AAC.2
MSSKNNGMEIRQSFNFPLCLNKSCHLASACTLHARYLQLMAKLIGRSMLRVLGPAEETNIELEEENKKDRDASTFLPSLSFLLFSQIGLICIASRGKRGEKGEIDAVIVDADGVAQVAVEVKTAKGNPYTVLHGDLEKLQPMLDMFKNLRDISQAPVEQLANNTNIQGAVRGKEVTLTSASCQKAAGEPHQTRRHTLTFSPNLKPMYILASRMAAFGPDMENAARRSILSKEINRELSMGIDAWGDIQIAKLDPGAVLLQVEGQLLQDCLERVDKFFRGLDQLDVFVLPSEGEQLSEPLAQA